MALGRKLGPSSVYWLIFNPLKMEDRVAGSLADDFADIYGNLKPGLIGYMKGGRNRRNAAIGEWRLHRPHWERHATNALRVLQEIHSRQED